MQHVREGRSQAAWIAPREAPSPRVATERGWLMFDGVLFDGSPSHGSALQEHLATAATLDRLWREKGSQWQSEINGDVAIIRYDADTLTLVLARSPLCSRPLFYRASDARWDVATLPVLTDAAEGIDIEAIANRLVPDGLVVGADSVFKGWAAVLPGCEVALSARGAAVRRYWDCHRLDEGSITIAQAAAALRQGLTDAAIGAVRRGSTAVHLSGGRDSSAVAACVAKSGEGCWAMTAGPIADGTPWDAYRDETGVAAAVAALWPPLDHVVVRPHPIDLPHWLDRVHQFHPEPLASPVGLPWWVALNTAMRERSIDRVLTGQAGNFGVSLGGPAFVPDLIRKGHWKRALAIVSTMDGGWREKVKRSLLPFLPQRWRRLIAHGGASHPSFFKGELEQWRLRRLDERHLSGDASATYRSWLCDTLNELDHADQFTESLFGVSPVDPTASRTVVEAALRLPVAALAGTERDRPAYAAAFGEMLPIEVVRATARGRQNLDYHRTIDPDLMRAGIERYRRNRIAAQWIDFDAMNRALERWPDTAERALKAYRLYAVDLMDAMALASFLNVHFSDGSTTR